MPGDEFEAMRVDLFAKFVLAMLKNPEFKPAELRELSALHKTLYLTAEQLGDALSFSLRCYKLFLILH